MRDGPGHPHVENGGRAAAWLLVAAGVLAGAACGKQVSPPIATLVENSGLVEGTTETAPWRTVTPGAPFALGDAVRTGAGAFARLRLTTGGTIRLGENSLVRFRVGAPAPERNDRGGPEVSVELGRAEIVEADELSVQSPAGRMRVDRGARVRIDADAEKVKVEVIVGRALVSGSAGAVAVDAGHGISFRIGGAILERFDLTVGRAMVEPLGHEAGYKSVPLAASPEPAPAASPSSVTATVRDAKPSAGSAGEQHADVTFTAGDSAVIHNDKVPLAVRLRFDGICTGEASVELGQSPEPLRARKALQGSGSVVLHLRAGRTPYRVRCLEDGAASAERSTDGVLSLKRDSGNAPLARQAPSNTIEADGRRYTVLFQSRPPVLTLTWAAPKGATDLELHIDSGGQTRTIHAPGPTYRLPSGALGEGTHTWWYVASDGHASPRTTLAIHFDNTAPTAQFFPGSVVDGPNGAITVDGVVVQGSKVSAAGQPLAVDDHGRFRAAVLPLSGDTAVAVHIESPRGGSHYYIRRKVGTP